MLTWEEIETFLAKISSESISEASAIIFRQFLQVVGEAGKNAFSPMAAGLSCFVRRDRIDWTRFNSIIFLASCGGAAENLIWGHFHGSRVAAGNSIISGSAREWPIKKRPSGREVHPNTLHYHYPDMIQTLSDAHRHHPDKYIESLWPRLLFCGTTDRLWALRACLTLSFAAFGRSGRVN